MPCLCQAIYDDHLGGSGNASLGVLHGMEAIESKQIYINSPADCSYSLAIARLA